MPAVPFPVGGIVYDTDGATLLVGATVILQNLRTLDLATKTTQSDGSYAFNLSNETDFPSSYVSGDDLLFVAKKAISSKAEKYVMDTSSVSGDSVEKNLTVKLYIDKSLIPLAGMDKRDIEMRVFEPSARATRIIPVTEEGVTYHLIGKRISNSQWDLVLPDGTVWGRITSDQFQSTIPFRRVGELS